MVNGGYEKIKGRKHLIDKGLREIRSSEST